MLITNRYCQNMDKNVEKIDRVQGIWQDSDSNIYLHSVLIWKNILLSGESRPTSIQCFRLGLHRYSLSKALLFVSFTRFKFSHSVVSLYSKSRLTISRDIEIGLETILLRIHQTEIQLYISLDKVASLFKRNSPALDSRNKVNNIGIQTSEEKFQMAQ